MIALPWRTGALFAVALGVSVASCGDRYEEGPTRIDTGQVLVDFDPSLPKCPRFFEAQASRLDAAARAVATYLAIPLPERLEYRLSDTKVWPSDAPCGSFQACVVGGKGYT